MTNDTGAGPVITADGEATTAPAVAPKKRARGIPFRFLIPAVIALDILAVVVVPPFPKGGQTGQACDFPSCFVQSAIELPPPSSRAWPPMVPVSAAASLDAGNI